MQTFATSTLSETQSREIAKLTKSCQKHDKIRLSYPSDESGDGCCHYLLYEEDGTLSAILAIILLEDGLAECSAFTHPACRRQGFFSCLLGAATEQWEECDILFTVSESCPDTMAVLSALGAELESREHQMELELPQSTIVPGTDPCSDFPRHTGLNLLGRTSQADTPCPDIPCPDTPCSGYAEAGGSAAQTVPETIWTLTKHGEPIGQCIITPVSDACVCLHHLEITEPQRGKGYGSDFLSMLLPRLAYSGICKILLQVSGDNPAALALYRKTGFRITETLSFFCY